MNRLQPFLVVLGLVMGTACENSRTVPDAVFQALEGADRMDVASPSRQVRSVVARWRIRKTARYLQHFSQGWKKPFSGTPLSNLTVTFYQGPNLLSRFGIGDGFIAMGDSLLWYQALTPKERDDLLKLLAVEERRAATSN